METKLRKFLPLITILTIVIVATFIKLHITGMWSFHDVMTTFMGFFFLVFGTFKILNLFKFAEAFAEYDLIAKHSKIYALAYPFIELKLGILYITHHYLFYANIFTLILMLVSALGVAIELSKRREIVCACLGALFNIPMTYVTLFEDLVMAGMALAMLFK